MPPSPSTESLLVTPIGYVRTPFADRVSAPRQASEAPAVTATVELASGRGFEFALEDLDGWQHLWLVFWFHLNTGWHPKVLPPRSSKKRGVFSTRSPYRPNPIGLSAVELVRIEGLILHIRGVDLVDGTPVLDIKPYVPYSDAIVDSRTGWLSERSRGSGEAYEVVFTEGARTELDWLAARGVLLESMLRQLLVAGPKPHPYRRIRADGDGFRIALHAWRARFHLDGLTVRVEKIVSGYRPQQLAVGDTDDIALHRAFEETFSTPPIERDSDAGP